MRKFPNAFVIILSVIFLAWILTFIIPQGSYQRNLDSVSNRTIVVSNSYEAQQVPHLSAFDVLLAIPRGPDSPTRRMFLLNRENRRTESRVKSTHRRHERQGSICLNNHYDPFFDGGICHCITGGSNSYDTYTVTFRP